ncbi:FKBP-type peptidyl-prolyl cis-trans isomerase [Geobacter sp. FeAm09]|uniref:FKBP-type peptidyl-prolyl cis-trans isomerase n=1 Tax=Geobacter sp. FeAm09 TaxID=2597769 RepID=UPI0011ED207E|nr:FKBP-type peptidyl-prolyl cis-trans isomerase [Geobacter sp. FeAm09]QEM69309.1 FKBP-type peptidyl-prolyl cis-trans isomerase [Geobacter sp. FeAm09]
MRRLLLAVLATLIAIPAFAAEAPQTEEQKTLYAIGLIVARQLSVFNLTPAELDLVRQGLTDGTAGTKPLVEVEAYLKKVQELATARRNAKGEKLAAAAAAFLAQAGREKGAVTTKSGIVYLSLKEGAGVAPTASDKVKVHYRGTLTDGTEFDSSYKRGEPAEFPLKGVIPCWTEGVQLMKVGGKARLVCPAATAYGEQGNSSIPANAALVFEIELLGVTK